MLPAPPCSSQRNCKKQPQMIWSILVLSVGLTNAYENVQPEYLSHLRAAGRDEEFARLLGLDDVKLVRPNTDERSEFTDVRNEAVSPLGDIMLTKEQSEQVRQNIRFSAYPTMRWEKHFISYFIEENDFKYWQIPIIVHAIEEMNLNITYLKIIPRFKYHENEDCIYIFSGQGCWSYLGRRGGTQPLSLQWDSCVRKPTVQHELMHVIGFTHEQNRYDRDKYIDMHWENIPKDWQMQYEKVDNDDFQHDHPYDYYSVMHYPIKAPESDKDAFSVKQEGVNKELIGNGPGLTEIDVKKINDVYQRCNE